MARFGLLSVQARGQNQDLKGKELYKERDAGLLAGRMLREERDKERARERDSVATSQ